MNLLVFEDDGGSRRILSENLGGRGHTVRLHDDLGQALADCRRDPPDAVLSDIHLPGLSGTGHIASFCGLEPAPLVIVMTGFPALETCLECLRHGAWGYLVKPFRVEEFLQLAERGLAERRLAAQAAALQRRVAELEAELERLRPPPSARGSAPDERSL
jgi:DNA-binding NtrC family response regulator